MARHQRNTLLAALVSEAGWSAAELARSVNGLGAAHGLTLRYDRTSVAHWLTGSRPRSPVPDLVAQAFSRRTGRLITAVETGLALSPQERKDAYLQAQFDEVDPVRHLVCLTRGDADPARRAFLVQSVFSLDPISIPAWPHAHPTPHATGSGRVTMADAQMLHDMTQVFADLAIRHGGAHARSALALYLSDDAAPLLHAAAPTSLRRDLLTAGAHLTYLLAVMTTDAGHHALAQHYYRTALGLAREADNRSAYAVTLRAMSVQALRLGHHRQAVDLAETAVETAGRVTPATKAFLLAQRAVARAQDRGQRPVLTDLIAAEAQHERASSPPGAFTDYPRAGLDYQRAQALHALGQRADALSALRASAAHRPQSQRRTFALTQAHLAETLLDLGHLEEACTHWQHFLDHYPHLHSTQTQQALTRMQARLRPYQHQTHASVLLGGLRGL